MLSAQCVTTEGVAAPDTKGALSTERAPPQRIEIHVDGPESAVRLVRDTAQELFQRHGVRVDVVGPSDHALQLDSVPLAIATLRLHARRFNLLVMDGIGNEIERRELRGQTSLETSIEAATHIIYFIVDSLLQNQQERKQTGKRERLVEEPQTPSAEEARETPQAKAPRKARSLPLAYDLGVFFSSTSLGASRLLAGGGVLADARWSMANTQVGVMFAASTHIPSEIEYLGASALVRPSSAKALAVLDLASGPLVSFSLASGPGLTWLSVVPNRSTSEVEATAARSLFEPVFAFAAGLKVSLTEHTFVSALAGLDISLAQQRFVAEQDDQRQLVLATPRVRPLLMLAACASLEGPSRFAVASEGSP